MNGQRVGYTRVSTLEQNTDRQLDGIDVDRAFADHVSGKDLHRPQLTAMLQFVREGDTVVVHSMDRLARNLDDLRATVRDLTARGVRVEFVKEQLTFTGDDTAMATLLLSVMGAFAEFERALIRERQREGIALAKQRGVPAPAVQPTGPRPRSHAPRPARNSSSTLNPTCAHSTPSARRPRYGAINSHAHSNGHSPVVTTSPAIPVTTSRDFTPWSLVVPPRWDVALGCTPSPRPSRRRSQRPAAPTPRRHRHRSVPVHASFGYLLASHQLDAGRPGASVRKPKL